MTYEIEATANRIIKLLNRDGHPDKATLSSLINAPTITSQRAQTVWPILMANLDKNQLSHTGVPTPGEVAVYTAIRFYAIYQQGQDQFVYGKASGDQPDGIKFFTALAKLRQNEETRKALDSRVQNVLATTNAASVINGLSHLNSLLKGRNGVQKIDFAWLAQDLYRLQASYEQSTQVRLLWGQQYFRVQLATTKTEGVEN